MPLQLKYPPSQLAKLEKKIVAVLPKGLPKDVKKFYANSDGLRARKGSQEFVLVGLADMFDGFRKHVTVKKAQLDHLEWTDLPFYERFFNEDGDETDARSLAQLNLRMRLKLLSSVEGESTELAIDYFDKKPTLYVVNRADSAYPLIGLGFGDFVQWFSKFGTARWYYAFLDKSAEKSMNVDLRAELERSLAEFPAKEWAPLLARLPKPKAPRATAVATAAPMSAAPVERTAFPSLKEAPLVIEEDGPRWAVFGGGGRLLVAGSGNYDLWVYEVASRKRLWKQKKAQRVSLSPDGNTLAILEGDKAFTRPDRLVLRSCGTGKALGAPWKSGTGLDEVSFAGGGRVVVADINGTLHVIDAATQQTVKTISGLKEVAELARVGDSALIVAHLGDKFGAGPSTVQLVDLDAGALGKRWANAIGYGVSPDARLLALRYFKSGRSVVEIVELASGRAVEKLQGAQPHPDNNPQFGFHLRFSPDGSRLAFAQQPWSTATKSLASTVSFFDTKNWKQVDEVDLGKRADRPNFVIDADGLALSSDGLMCVASDHGGLRLWRA